MPHLLLISNGHGEDAIGVRLAAALRESGCTIEALPIVGTGQAYVGGGVPLAGPTAVMPSGGFIHGRPVHLARDLRHGLLSLTRAQWAAVRAGRGRWHAVLAVGDVVPLAFAWGSGLPFGFVGCAKSDWYLGGRPVAYGWHERWLLRRPACLGVWPRDALTTGHLVAAGVRAAWLGNPMMDALGPTGRALPAPEAIQTVLLLPGSRQEAPRNLARLAEAVVRLQRPGRRFLAALAASPEGEGWAPPGWTRGEGGALRHPDGATIWLRAGAFSDVAHAADVALAMAGTATEQVVGLGKPAVALPGPGPQFTRPFARAQVRLLGEAVLLADTPADAASLVEHLLAAPEERARRGAVGAARMGPPGASRRITEALLAALAGPEGGAVGGRLREEPP